MGLRNFPDYGLIEVLDTLHDLFADFFFRKVACVQIFDEIVAIQPPIQVQLASLASVVCQVRWCRVGHRFVCTGIQVAEVKRNPLNIIYLKLQPGVKMENMVMAGNRCALCALMCNHIKIQMTKRGYTLACHSTWWDTTW